MKKIINVYNSINIFIKMGIGLLLGVGLAYFSKTTSIDLSGVSIFGTLFIQALKAIAPILVLFLVITAISNHKEGGNSNIKRVIMLYVGGTLIAAVVAVSASFLFPIKIPLNVMETANSAPQNLAEILNNILLSVVANPVTALTEANYLGILFWSVLLGLALRKANDATKNVMADIADGISMLVKWVVSFAPFGIMGIVFTTASEDITKLFEYGGLILLLVGTMLFMALVVNPLIVLVLTRQNPFPLVFATIKESAITAFFTRSSAANIPVNMELCKKLNLNEDTYSVSIPLGSTINMGGAAITITILTLAAVNTLGIKVDIVTALVLSVMAAVSACGTSGVAGGSLLLVPIACSLFGIDESTAAAVMGAGFTVSIIQDSLETAINSSTDVLYTAIAEKMKKN